jgi:hypothetical protein
MTGLGVPHSGYEYGGDLVHDWGQGGYTYWTDRETGASERYQHWICFCHDDDPRGKTKGHDVWIRADV